VHLVGFTIEIYHNARSHERLDTYYASVKIRYKTMTFLAVDTIKLILRESLHCTEKNLLSSRILRV